ncbi:protein-export chaperone SecB [Aliidiomarina maris]|uniref:Protein-export protein SecB n=1 Tax=Aliidiomarina maris TaxID=531312 RepID=A0A327X7H8_9GAMM|nr:protein-export chaperone SecB [Aliidiomarina maris]MBA3988664.1 protein-export chaperone SecB [Idiomarina sp.]RAJ99116.1 protein translocase subunit secB [Aliidiomarina maris]RUO27726.1 protein-export chaperone SecB [Aliidiomarina maris]
MADENQQAQQNGAAQGEQQQPQFAIQRIFVKDVSFEAPNAPEIFRKEWTPQLSVDMNVNNKKLDEGVYEVTLTLTAKNTVGEETAFLCEVAQAGIFTVSEEMPEPNKAHTLGAFCPNILFPYARETISSLVTRGTFPQLNLAPVNFDAVFAQHVQQQQAQQQAAEQKQDA